RKVNGRIMKFWNAAIWSNLSAQIAATRPSAPSMALPASANTTIHSGAASGRSANEAVTASTHDPTVSPRITDASTDAPQNSTCEIGGSRTKIRLPVTLDWIRLDELLANEFCSTLIMTSPGTRNVV